MKGFVCFYEIRHWAHSILFWWLMVISPIAGIFTLDVIFSSGSVTDLPVAVCDLDNSSMSRQILRWVDAAPSMKAAFKPEGVEDADLLMRTGKIYASIIIPANFERDMQHCSARVSTVHASSGWL